MHNLKQNTPEWLEFRRSHIGASDAPIILGVSPYKTVYQLWLEKTGQAESKSNAAMQYGREQEEQIREWYELKSGQWFPPTVLVHPDYPWMSASLDGLSGDGEVVLEIKTCNAKDFSAIQRGVLREDYRIQAQHQLAVSKARVVRFVCFHQGEYAELPCLPDEKLMEEIIAKESDFYHNHLLSGIPPEIEDTEHVDMTADEAWLALELEASMVYPELKELEKKWATIRQQFIDLSDDGNCKGNKVKLTRSFSKGAVDYVAMQADGIDLEKYRKGATSRVTVELLKS